MFFKDYDVYIELDDGEIMALWVQKYIESVGLVSFEYNPVLGEWFDDDDEEVHWDGTEFVR